jgi:hypothetical protein
MAPTTQPVTKPDLSNTGILWRSMQGDDFDSTSLGLQWHFLTRKAAASYSLSARKGWVRLTPDTSRTHLVQKETAHYYTAVTRLQFDAADPSAKAGIYLTNGNQHVVARLYTGHDNGRRVILQLDTATRSIPAPAGNILWLKLERKWHHLTGYYSADGIDWVSLGSPVSAVPLDKEQPNFNSWVGASIGLFAEGRPADFDLFTVKDAFSPIEAAGYANYYGIKTISLPDDKAVTNTSAEGGWFMIPGIETGRRTPSAVELTVSANTGGALEIGLDDLGNNRLIATIPFKANPNGQHGQILKGKVKNFKGHHDLFIRVTPGTQEAIQIRSLRFLR